MRFQYKSFHTDYEEIAAKARSAGLNASILPLKGGFERLVVQVQTVEGTEEIDFRLTDHGCFAFKPEQVLQFEESNLSRMFRDLATLPLDSVRVVTQRLETAASRSLTRSDWHQLDWDARRILLSKYGWQIDDDNRDFLRSQFYNCVEIRQTLPLGRLSKFLDPQMSWNVRHFCRIPRNEEYAVEQEFLQTLMHSFKQLVRPDSSMIAVARNGYPALFYPHQCSSKAIANHWYVEVLPLVSDVAFIDTNCAFGYLGSYFSGTVTAFGEKLVSMLQSSKSHLLASPIVMLPPTPQEWQLLFAEWKCSGWSQVPESHEAQIKEMIQNLSDVDGDPIIPSRVWDVSAITESVQDAVAIEKSVISILAKALSRHSSEGTVWYAFSDPYPVCKLEVPLQFPAHDSSCWAIQMISRFANSHFIRSDFKEGITCHNLRGKLCLFGAGMSSESLPLPLIGPD